MFTQFVPIRLLFAWITTATPAPIGPGTPICTPRPFPADDATSETFAEPALMVASAESSSGFGSGVPACTLAESTKLPAAVVCTVNVKPAPAFTARVPILHTIVAPCSLTLPCVTADETSVAPAGKVLNTVTFVEAEGP